MNPIDALKSLFMAPEIDRDAPPFSMKKSYQVKVHPAQGPVTMIDITASTFMRAMTVRAKSDSRIQLIDRNTGLAPDTIRANRKGQDLHISFDGRDQADLIITDFYNPNGTSQSVLVGELKLGIYHAYIPESGDWSRGPGQIEDGASPTGMVLGVEQIPFDQAIEPAAASGLLALTAFNPLWATPVLLLGALANGDTKASPGRTPSIQRAELYSADDTGQSNSDGITSKDKPRISGTTEAYANVKITIGGHVYEGKADAQGQFLIPITDALLGTVQTYQVTVTDASGNTATADGKPFVLDTSNISSSQNVGVVIESISQDTGFDSGDFLTGDNTLTWGGTLNTSGAPFNSEDWLQLLLLDAQSRTLASQYIKPTQTAGVWRWVWAGDALQLIDGQYMLKAQLVDTAGNLLTASPWTRQAWVDTQPQSKSNGQADPNTAFVTHIGLLQPDTGSSATDFLSSGRQLRFTGSIKRSTGTGGFDASSGRVLTEIIDATGKIVTCKYLTPTEAGDWTFDSSAVALGVPGAVTNYVLKSYIVDMAGNPLSASSQAFTIDLRIPTVKNAATVSQAGGFDYTEMSFASDEQGTYFFNGIAQTTGTLSLNGTTHFEPGQFNIRFEDTAGNVWLNSNAQAWDFVHLTKGISLLSTSSVDTGAFNAGQLVGSVGKYVIQEPALDLASLHNLTPARDGQGAMNYLDMRGHGAQTLKVSIADVLALGIANSFSTSPSYADHLQMRIDGDGTDKLTLSKQWGNSNDQSWLAHGQVTLDGQIYNAYFNQSLALEVFVQSTIAVTVI